MAIGLGMKVNQEPFWILAKRLPIQFLKRRRPEQIYGVLIHVAGFEMKDIANHQKREIKELCRFFQIERMDKFVWKYKGLRPHGFPEIRIKQLAQMIIDFDWSNDFKTQSLLKNWSTATKSLSKQAKDLMKINTLVPYIYWLSIAKDESESSNMDYLDLLINLKPEKNQLMSRLKSCGFEIENALDSQALLSLFRTKCAWKKCLQCEIGHELMSI